MTVGIYDLNGNATYYPNGMTREEWLEIRRGYIGGSDAATVCGLNPYKSRFELWAEKVGIYESRGSSMATEAGTRLEPVLRQWFTDTEEDYEAVTDDMMHVSPAHPFMAANLDGRVRFKWGGTDQGIWEAKTAGLRSAGRWDDGVPVEYDFQVHHYMAVTDLPQAWVSVLIGGQDFRTILVERDEQKVQLLIEQEAEFWQLVEEGTPPEIDGSESTRETIRAVYHDSEAKAVDLVPAFRDLCAQQRFWKEKEEQCKAERAAYENQIKAALGHAEIGRVDGQIVATWKKAKGSESFDKEAFVAAHPDLYKQFTRQTEGSRRLLIK